MADVPSDNMSIIPKDRLSFLGRLYCELTKVLIARKLKPDAGEVIGRLPFRRAWVQRTVHGHPVGHRMLRAEIVHNREDGRSPHWIAGCTLLSVPAGSAGRAEQSRLSGEGTHTQLMLLTSPFDVAIIARRVNGPCLAETAIIPAGAVHEPIYEVTET